MTLTITVKSMPVKSTNVSLEEKMNGETNNVDLMVMSIVQDLKNVLNVQMLGIVTTSPTKLPMSLPNMMQTTMDKLILQIILMLNTIPIWESIVT